MLRWLPALVLGLLLSGCATLPADLPPAPQSHALAPQPGGPLAEAEAALHARQPADTSGFHLLAANEESLRWRLALVDAAQHALDLQYYVWWGDESGALLMSRVIAAADRGVKVRLVIDDLATSSVVELAQERLSDAGASLIDAHPNIEVRLFNPWRRRSLFGRVVESIGHLGRVNQRMHNKLMIADNRAVIIGGRNIGNEYFGLAPTFNFHDLDTLGVGPVARQASEVFDRYWNSPMAVPVSALGIDATPADLERAVAKVTSRLAGAERLEHFEIAPQDWRDRLGDLVQGLHAGTSRVVADAPGGEQIDHLMPQQILTLLESAEREVTIANAYIIPGEGIMAWLRGQVDRGVRYRILTNSLASHDVPAVNAHYKGWRDDLLAAGVELYEMRADAEVQAELVDTPPVSAEFMGLHAKAMVVDDARVFIGSMNLDPRSWSLNSEVGVIVESPGLAAELLAVIDRDLEPENSWHVVLDEDGDVVWISEGQLLESQPARGFWQRVEELFLGLLPKEIY